MRTPTRRVRVKMDEDPAILAEATYPERVKSVVTRLLATVEALEAENATLTQTVARAEKLDVEVSQLREESRSDKRTIDKLQATIAALSAELDPNTAPAAAAGGGLQEEESEEDDDGFSAGPGEAVPPETAGRTKTLQLQSIARTESADNEGPLAADVEKRTLIEQMFAAGDITEQEYDEMVERMEQVRAMPTKWPPQYLMFRPAVCDGRNERPLDVRSYSSNHGRRL